MAPPQRASHQDGSTNGRSAPRQRERRLQCRCIPAIAIRIGITERTEDLALYITDFVRFCPHCVRGIRTNEDALDEPIEPSHWPTDDDVVKVGDAPQR